MAVQTSECSVAAVYRNCVSIVVMVCVAWVWDTFSNLWRGFGIVRVVCGMGLRYFQ